ncbi:MAG: J domain-containing protein [Sandaracinaceae bacterium]
MDALPGAAALTRGLLVLTRSRSSGVLSAVAEDVHARIALRDGRVVALTVEGVAPRADGLGVQLRAMDAWDHRAAEDAEPKEEGESLGRWVSRVGVASQAAVSCALRRQMRQRLAVLFALEPPELRLTAGPCDLGVPMLDEPPTASELVVGALRARMARTPLVLIQKRLGSGFYALTPLGRELLDGAPLFGEEHAIAAGLERGASVDTLLGLARREARAYRFLFGLKLLSACGPPASSGGYSLLLRKKRELARHVRASQLLELPARADVRATKRAWRKLAGQLHPDRFTRDPDLAIQAASHDVMRALDDARRRVSG